MDDLGFFRSKTALIVRIKSEYEKFTLEEAQSKDNLINQKELHFFSISSNE